MHMATVTKQWTLEEVHSLPDDGNKYELVRGELFAGPDGATASAGQGRIVGYGAHSHTYRRNPVTQHAAT